MLPEARTIPSAIQLLSSAIGFSNCGNTQFSLHYSKLSLLFALKFKFLIACICDYLCGGLCWWVQVPTAALDPLDLEFAALVWVLGT